jgi:hypothetical protein
LDLQFFAGRRLQYGAVDGLAIKPVPNQAAWNDL